VLEQQRNLTMEHVAAQLQTRTTLAPGTDAKPPNFEPPLDELETLIATVWQEVFGIVHIGRRDNFFDLGGHSLLSIQLISRLRNVLQLPDIALSLLFEAPTVAALATAIRATRRVSEPDLEALASDGDSEIATLLAEIEGMSEEEILAALARE
jgi:hypothetical protein